MDKKLAATFKSVSFLPSAWLALFALFVFRAKQALGSWPSFDQPDPKALGFNIHHFIILALLTPTLLSAGLWVSLAAVLRRGSVKHNTALYALLFVPTYIILLLIVFWDPTGLFEWLMD